MLLEWSQAGESVDAEFAQALDVLDTEVQAGEIKKMLGGEHDRNGSSARPISEPGLGGVMPDWLGAEMTVGYFGLGKGGAGYWLAPLDGAPRLQARADRLPAR